MIDSIFKVNIIIFEIPILILLWLLIYFIIPYILNEKRFIKINKLSKIFLTIVTCLVIEIYGLKVIHCIFTLIPILGLILLPIFILGSITAVYLALEEIY